MSPRACVLIVVFLNVRYGICSKSDTKDSYNIWTKEVKSRMRVKVLEMFNHAYNSYMTHAYPADELMPLSCKGRYRGSEADRGDIDEALGNFSLTLIDSLDTLAVIGNIEEFERATMLVIRTVSFNTDVVVSVFETNIRVLGGLLGAHTVAVNLREAGKGMLWYRNELLEKAVDLGDRLLLAFNTSTDIPFPKVNLKYGIYNSMSRVGHEQDTCTACAGTMIMEFAALSRLSGNPIYEEKAHKAMEAIWHYRSRYSDLVGTVINIHNGDWVRRDSGIGAGIDSYYEYCLKAYVLLGDESYLAKFNKHYHAINKYIRQGSMMLDVLMHQPEKPVRTFMDALQAFWPGLQVLLGDLKPAIETHEMLYEVAKRHKFIPEALKLIDSADTAVTEVMNVAFTSNLDVYWGQHPLRPELAESTYFLYEATKDPYYLEVGQHIIEAMQDYARVPCGFAAVKDVRTLSHEDKMDSFVLAETFKYLYLLFSEEENRVINVHDFLFTTEAHLLPLTLSNLNSSGHAVSQQSSRNHSLAVHAEESFLSSCPNKLSYQNMPKHTEEIRKRARIVNQGTCSTTEQKILETYVNTNPSREPKLRAEHFQVGNKDHLKMAKEMGITITLTQDGRVQLMHQAALALTTEDAQDGIKFMQDMIQLAKTRGEQQGDVKPRVVQLMSEPYKDVVFSAGAAQFGVDLQRHDIGITAEIQEAVPLRACLGIQNKDLIKDRIILIERGDCMFIDKVRHSQKLGALGVIIIDHNEGTSSETQPTFAMSGDNNSVDVSIPSVFLFRKEGVLLRTYMQEAAQNDRALIVRIAAKAERRDQPTLYVQDPEKNASLDAENVPNSGSSQLKGDDHKSDVSIDEAREAKTEESISETRNLDSGVRKKVEDPSGHENMEEHQNDQSDENVNTYSHGKHIQIGGSSVGKTPFCFDQQKEDRPNIKVESSEDPHPIGGSVEEQLRAIHAEVDKTMSMLDDVGSSISQTVSDRQMEAVLGMDSVQKGILLDNSEDTGGHKRPNPSLIPMEMKSSCHSEISQEANVKNDNQEADSVDSRNVKNFLSLDEEYDKANAAKIRSQHRDNDRVQKEPVTRQGSSDTTSENNHGKGRR